MYLLTIPDNVKIDSNLHIKDVVCTDTLSLSDKFAHLVFHDLPLGVIIVNRAPWLRTNALTEVIMLNLCRLLADCSWNPFYLSSNQR